VEIIAHRGLALNEVENTLPSFKHALENGADAIELDVHESKDGNVIVFHDFDLRRLFQLDKLTYELSWEELKRLKFPGKDYGIPLLEDVFRQINSKFDASRNTNRSHLVGFYAYGAYVLPKCLDVHTNTFY